MTDNIITMEIFEEAYRKIKESRTCKKCGYEEIYASPKSPGLFCKCFFKEDR